MDDADRAAIARLRVLGPRHQRVCTARNARVLRDISYRSALERARRRLIAAGIVLTVAGGLVSALAVVTGWRLFVAVDLVCVAVVVVCLVRVYRAT